MKKGGETEQRRASEDLQNSAHANAMRILQPPLNSFVDCCFILSLNCNPERMAEARPSAL